jgi:hypothetical protein
MCLGACAVYAVEIDAAGLVTFIGRPSMIAPHAPCQGRRQWRIPAAAVARLQTLIDRAGFFGFKQSYTASITDQSGYDVTITRYGRTKAVRDYVGQMAGMPPAMTEIEEAIDIAADDRNCVVGPPAAAQPGSEKLQGVAAPRH